MVEFRKAQVNDERVNPNKHRIADYLRPKTLAMLLLGFSSVSPGRQYVWLLAAR